MIKSHTQKIFFFSNLETKSNLLSFKTSALKQSKNKGSDTESSVPSGQTGGKDSLLCAVLLLVDPGQQRNKGGETGRETGDTMTVDVRQKGVCTK